MKESRKYQTLEIFLLQTRCKTIILIIPREKMRGPDWLIIVQYFWILCLWGSIIIIKKVLNYHKFQRLSLIGWIFFSRIFIGRIKAQPLQKNVNKREKKNQNKRKKNEKSKQRSGGFYKMNIETTFRFHTRISYDEE